MYIYICIYIYNWSFACREQGGGVAVLVLYRWVICFSTVYVFMYIYVYICVHVCAYSL